MSSTGMTPSWIEINVTRCPVHVSYKYLRNLPNKKKGKRSPSHCLFSVLAFFKS
ncbi:MULTISPECIES: hypothetical protein [unclassified Wolbachia]|uniref:hypothetical protein n=1 Tax=unclassified Wolbachia TaxID=2640676 RepID=UPI0022308D19|nr:hypothetical protein [Wolbachia endosymbiont (group A) of Apoderus coryli]